MAVSFIKSSGNIISEDFCKILAEDYGSSYVKSASFNAKKIEEDIAVTFDLLRERWEEIRLDIIEKKFDTTHLRNRWLVRVFDYLGYDPKYNKSNVKSDAGIEFQLSHIGWDSPEAPIIHMVGLAQDLDLKDASNRTHPNKSPHDLLQNFLNVDKHKWGILSNGHKIRILRDFHHSITKGYLEFDLEGIFETASLSDFRVMFILLNRTRFENQYEQNDSEDRCILETIYEKSQETGIEVGNKLRDQVRNAIESLGNGFIQNIDIDNFASDYPKHLYEEILNIIYRILFLLFAEQKGWLPIRNEVYSKTYSINALRELSEKVELVNDDHDDLWEGLKITFKLVSKGYTFPDGDHVNAFGGQLFSEKKIKTSYEYRLKNKFLLIAIKELSYFEQDKVKHKINYTTLAIEALGSVYESLLDYEPRITKEDEQINGKLFSKGTFILDDRSTERKTTGSYYTDSRLVSQLIDSALVPVIENAISGKETPKEMEEAILDLNVCDMAMGSAAFLVAALNKMGEELAKIRKGEEELPTEEQLREAKRDVLQNCIYGVDINPMAVELAKFSLWITASMPNLPLSFLDHKLKCGNSLIGATPALIKKGIPVEAYNPVTLDDPDICKQIKEKVKKELKQMEIEVNEPNNLYKVHAEIRKKEQLEAKRKKIYDSEQKDVDVIEELEEEYHKLIEEEKKYKDWLLANIWTAAFFIEKEYSDLNIYPTNNTLIAINENELIPRKIIDIIKEISDIYRFFHWHLEFPYVFEKGGFDCVLGNPPWELLNLMEEEFLGSKGVTSTKQLKGNERKEFLKKLEKSNQELFFQFLSAKRKSETITLFIQKSNKYNLSTHGRINTYSVFTNLADQCINNNGYFGLIVPTGIATDYSNQYFFNYLIENGKLISIYDFENRKSLFVGVEANMRFSLITVSNKLQPRTQFGFGFYLPEQVHNTDKRFCMGINELQMFNPNTMTCPTFLNDYEYNLSKGIYQNNPVLINDVKNINIYDIQFRQGLFNMTSDSSLFNKYHDLIKEEYAFDQNVFISNSKKKYLPLYEAKFINQHDSRFASYQGITNRYGTKTGTNYPTEKEKSDPSFDIECRFYVDEQEVENRIPEYWRYKWFVVFRDVIRPLADARCGIFTIIPKVGVGNTLPIIFFNDPNPKNILLKFAVFNTFVFDFLIRQKAGGAHLNFFILKQIPVIDVNTIPQKIKNRIIDIIIQLNYNSHQLNPLAHDLHIPQVPYKFNSESRFSLTCELDAIYGKLYKISEVDLNYILEAFPIVRKRDFDKYGMFRTKETILKYYNEF